jgi:hypothetical protein
MALQLPSMPAVQLPPMPARWEVATPVLLRRSMPPRIPPKPAAAVCH